MHSVTVKATVTKLSTVVNYTQGKVDMYFVSKINDSYGCYRQSMKRTNRIAAFQKIPVTGSEGGRRPSEALIYNKSRVLSIDDNAVLAIGNL